MYLYTHVCVCVTVLNEHNIQTIFLGDHNLIRVIEFILHELIAIFICHHITESWNYGLYLAVKTIILHILNGVFCSINTFNFAFN